MKRTLNGSVAFLLALPLVVQVTSNALGQSMGGAARTETPAPIPGPTLEELKDLGRLYIIRYGIPHPELVPGDMYAPLEFFGVEVPPVAATAWSLVDVVTGLGPPATGVTTDFDGAVYVLEVPDFIPPRGNGDQLDYSACDTHNVYGYVFIHSGGYPWWFNASSVPSELIVANARTAVQEGSRHWPQVDDSCGFADNMVRSQTYKGDTPDTADINGAGNCTTQDSKSVFDWGILPTTPFFALGRACPFEVYGGEATVDVRLTVHKDWVVNPSTSCTNKYDVESVATHERGHVWGLADITLQTDYEEQTMYNSTVTCDGYPEDDQWKWQRDLGYGDATGINSVYIS